MSSSSAAAALSGHAPPQDLFALCVEQTAIAESRWHKTTAAAALLAGRNIANKQNNRGRSSSNRRKRTTTASAVATTPQQTKKKRRVRGKARSHAAAAMNSANGKEMANGQSFMPDSSVGSVSLPWQEAVRVQVNNYQVSKKKQNRHDLTGGGDSVAMMSHGAADQGQHQELLDRLSAVPEAEAVVLGHVDTLSPPAADTAAPTSNNDKKKQKLPVPTRISNENAIVKELPTTPIRDADRRSENDMLACPATDPMPPKQAPSRATSKNDRKRRRASAAAVAVDEDYMPMRASKVGIIPTRRPVRTRRRARLEKDSASKWNGATGEGESDAICLLSDSEAGEGDENALMNDVGHGPRATPSITAAGSRVAPRGCAPCDILDVVPIFRSRRLSVGGIAFNVVGKGSYFTVAWSASQKSFVILPPSSPAREGSPEGEKAGLIIPVNLRGRYHEYAEFGEYMQIALADVSACAVLNAPIIEKQCMGTFVAFHMKRAVHRSWFHGVFQTLGSVKKEGDVQEPPHVCNYVTLGSPIELITDVVTNECHAVSGKWFIQKLNDLPNGGQLIQRRLSRITRLQDCDRVFGPDVFRKRPGKAVLDAAKKHVSAKRVPPSGQLLNICASVGSQAIATMSAVAGAAANLVFGGSLHTRSAVSRAKTELIAAAGAGVVAESGTEYLVYPSAKAPGAVSLTRGDVLLLAPGEWLNDSLVDFFVKYLWMEVFTKEMQSKCHIYSSLFYGRLQAHNKGTSVFNIDKWTLGIDIFQKKYLIFPICRASHWSLAIVCHAGVLVKRAEEGAAMADANGDGDASSSDDVPTGGNGADAGANGGAAIRLKKKVTMPEEVPCIILLDSLTLTKNIALRGLRDYLNESWRRRMTEKLGGLAPTEEPPFSAKTLKGIFPKAPQQENACDCGVFMLHFIEQFVQQPFKDVCRKDRTDWFSQEDIIKKREVMLDTVLRLRSRQQT